MSDGISPDVARELNELRADLHDLRLQVERLPVERRQEPKIIHAAPPADLEQRLRDIEEALLLAQRPQAAITPLHEVEKKAILDALQACDFEIERMASALQISKSTAYRRVKEYGLEARAMRRRGRIVHVASGGTDETTAQPVGVLGGVRDSA